MSPMGQYSEEVAVLGVLGCLSCATDVAHTLPAYVDVKAFSRVIAVGMGDALPFDTTLTVSVVEATDAVGTGAAVVGTNDVRNANVAMDCIVTEEVHESELTQGSTFVNLRVSQDDVAAHDLCGILLAGFPREKVTGSCWSPETTTAAPSTTTTAGQL